MKQTHWNSSSAVAAALAIAVLSGCGSSTSRMSSSATQKPAGTTAAVTTAADAPATTAASAPTIAAAVTTAKAAASTTTAAATVTTAATSSGSIVNTWTGATVDPTKLPIGDANVTTAGAGVGKLWACRAGNPNVGGAQADGPWLNTAAGTWDSTTKLKVNGTVSWPTAKYTETVNEGKRILTTNDLPVDGQTGTFPIAKDDPSYAYDRNPGTITATDKTVTLVENGTVAAATCMNEGPVGMLRNGVYVFNSLDGRGDDAVAHESQDLCDGHPAMTTYHYHNIPSCIRNATTGPSTVVGWAWDGFPIVVERDVKGALPTNADLDECHGRTSPLLMDGKAVTTYHYSATLEFPYFIGCFRGTAASVGR
jgi:hypothetical protein